MPTPTHQELAESYAALKVHCDAEAGRFKTRQTVAWALAWGSTVFIVAVCVLWLNGGVFPASWEPYLLDYAMPAASTFGTLVALYVQFRAPRGRWLKYRAATERLREHAMLYVLGRAPYDGPDYRARFFEFLHRVRQEADRREAFPHLPRRKPSSLDRGRPGTLGLFLGRALTAAGRRDPEMGRDGDHGHPPDRPLAGRVWDAAGTPAGRNREARRLVEERLCNQYHWHLNKCARYFRYYLLFQAAYMTVLMAAGLYASLVRRDFTLTAVSTLGSLVVLAFGEFMAYGTLSLRYYQLAGSLRRLHEAYFGRAPDPASPVVVRTRGKLDAAAAVSPEEERRVIGELADEVERTLSSEFRFWQLVHDTSTPAGDGRG